MLNVECLAPVLTLVTILLPRKKESNKYLHEKNVPSYIFIFDFDFDLCPLLKTPWVCIQFNSDHVLSLQGNKKWLWIFHRAVCISSSIIVCFFLSVILCVYSFHFVTPKFKKWLKVWYESGNGKYTCGTIYI